MTAEQSWVRLAGSVLWPTFLWAGVATMLFFATFDPIDLGAIATFAMVLPRIAGYTIGFFCFWAFGITCCISTLFLLKVVD
ncbi:MAG: hypothetical protein P8104_06750, partial [Gammaproteobacteria bacterium]